MYISRKEYFASSKKLAKKVKKIADVNVVRVYKNNEGLTTIKDLDWKKDPNALIENLFFNYHYGCESFVIIYKDNYAAVFGEYGHQQVTEALKDLLQTQNRPLKERFSVLFKKYACLFSFSISFCHSIPINHTEKSVDIIRSAVLVV